MSLETVKKLKPCEFEYNDCKFNFKQVLDQRIHFGFIAQDVLELFPIDTFAIVSERDGFYMVHKDQLIAPLVKAIQELAEKVEKLEEKINGNTL